MVCDFGSALIRKVTPTGSVTTISGSFPGYQDTNSDAGARYNGPWGIAVDSAGYTYISEITGTHIRRMAPSGWVTTVAGGNVGVLDGPGDSAQLTSPSGFDFETVQGICSYWMRAGSDGYRIW